MSELPFDVSTLYLARCETCERLIRYQNRDGETIQTECSLGLDAGAEDVTACHFCAEYIGPRLGDPWLFPRPPRQATRPTFDLSPGPGRPDVQPASSQPPALYW